MDGSGDSKKIRTSPISRRNSSNTSTTTMVKRSSKDEKISVSIRIRPLNTREQNNSQVYEALKSSSKKSVTEYLPNGKPRNNSTQEYDNVFDSKHSTEDIFDKVGKKIVNSCLGGINGTIFAYGQTSSGKTFTMNGGEEGKHPGLLPLSALHIFNTIDNAVDREYLLRVSFVEIYNEVVTDLFNPRNGPVKIRESRSRGVFVEAEEKIVNSFDDLMNVFALGNKNRHVASTNMNDRSSRSHTIFRITVESKEKTKKGDIDNDEENSNINSNDHKNSNRRLSNESVESTEAADLGGAVLVGALSLVDLAGSENVRNTGASGKTLREGGNINKSLLTLSGVIKALAAAKGKDVHVRFRDSKLTRILQPSLVGNCKTAVIGCVTPAAAHLDETRSTLRFASSAKNLLTKTSVNEILDDASMIKRLKRELYKLRKNAALTKDSQALIELQNSNKANQEDLVKAEQSVEEYKKQALEAEEKFKKVQSIMAKQIISGSVGIRHSSNVVDNNMSLLQTHQQQKKKRLSRRKKRETWCPGEMALPSTFDLSGGQSNSLLNTKLSNVTEVDENNNSSNTLNNNDNDMDGCDEDDEEESRVVESLSILKPITKLKRRSASRRRASVGGEQLSNSILKSSSSSSFEAMAITNRRDSHSFGKSIIAKKDDRITILKNQLVEKTNAEQSLQLKFDDQVKALEETKVSSNKEIERLRATIAEQQKEKFELVQKMKEGDDLLVTMKEDMSKKKAENEKVKAKLYESQNMHKDFVHETNLTNEKLAKEREAAMKKQTDVILEEKSNLEDKLSAANHEVTVFKTEISRLKTEYVVETAKVTEEKNAEIQSMQEVLIKAEQRADDIDAKATKLMKENCTLLAKIEKMSNEEETFKATQTKELQTKLQNIQSMRSKLAQTRDNTLNLIEQAKLKRNEKLTKDQETINTLNTKMVKLKEDIKIARDQQHEMEDSFATLQQKKSSKIRELEAMIELMKKEHEKKVESIDSSSTELNVKIEKLNKLLEEKTSHHTTIISNITKDHTVKLQQMEIQIDELKKNIQEEEEKRSATEEKNVKLMDKVNALEKSIEDENNRSTEMTAETENSKKDLENKHELLQQINDKLKGQLKTLQNEFENCENEKNVFANTTEQLQAENDKMKKSHTDNQFKMESMSTAIGKLEEKIKYLKDENNLRSDTQNTHDVDMLQEKLTKVTMKMETALNELGPLGFKNVKLNKKVKQLEQELVVVSNTLNKEQILRENVENKLLSSQKRFKALQKNLHMMREEHTNMTNDLESSAILQSQLQSSEEVIQELKKELKEKDKRIKYLDAHKITEHMKVKFKNMQSKYEKSKSDCGILKNKCVQLKKKLDEASSSGGGKNRSDKNDKMVRLLQDKLRKYLDLNNDLKKEKEAICKLDYIKDLINKKKLPLRDALKQLVKALKIAANKQKKNLNNNDKKEFKKLQAKFVELKISHDNIQSKLNEKVSKLESLHEKYESVKGEKNEIKTVGVRRLNEYKNEITESKNEIDLLRAKLEKSNNAYDRAEEAHKESIRFLEKENLELLLEVKKLKSAIDVVVGNKNTGNKIKKKNHDFNESITKKTKVKSYDNIMDDENDTADLTNYIISTDKENFNNSSLNSSITIQKSLSAAKSSTKTKKKVLKDRRESLASLHDVSIENFTDMTGTIAGRDDFDDEEAPECTQQ